MKALVVLSGGQDSTTCLFLAKAEGYELHAITFNYGQRHAREVDSAFTVGRMAGVCTHHLIDIPGILVGTSPLVNKDVTLEQYKDHQSLPGGIEKTFVPCRNQLFLTIALNRAVALGGAAIFTGVSEEDFGGYPDCRGDFIDSFNSLSIRGLKDAVSLVPMVRAPLLTLSKAETVRLARRLPGCWDALAYTTTSYDGAYPPVGKDHATLLRAKGFEEAGFPDPLVLRAHKEGFMPLPSTPNYDRARSA